MKSNIKYQGTLDLFYNQIAAYIIKKKKTQCLLFFI